MAETMAAHRERISAAKAYGADTALFVPCRFGGMPMPEAREFDIHFDEKTGHLKQVVAGDNAKYQSTSKPRITPPTRRARASSGSSPRPRRPAS